MDNASNKASYAQIANHVQFPTKEQAVVFDAVEGITVQEYTRALSKITDSKNIRFVSRISHSRVCFYLNSKDTADKLTDSHAKIHIGQHVLEARPLISKAKRIIISNVCPIIPHDVIGEELVKKNIRPVSQITFIRAGMGDPGFAHILSFRRQIYIHPEDVSKLPPILEINYESTNYWIYLSGEKLSCFICKEEGHLARFCKSVDKPVPNADPSIVSSPVTLSFPNTQIASGRDNVNINKSISAPVVNPQASFTPDLSHITSKSVLPTESFKRPLSSTHSTCDLATELVKADKQVSDIKVNKKKLTKRIKVSSESGTTVDVISTQLTPAKELISTNLHKFPLNLSSITEFLFLSFDNAKILETASLFTDDIPALINMLSEVKVLITERNLKSRIGRIIKKLSSSDVDDSASSDALSVDAQDN